MNDDVNVLVLAAGHGSRMRSTTPKVLHRVAGKAMIEANTSYTFSTTAHTAGFLQTTTSTGLCLSLIHI